MPRDVVLAVDQGSSSTKVVAVDAGGAVVARASVAVGEQHPRPGWVEQDPDELRSSVHRAIDACLAQLGGLSVAGIGLSNQRESIVLWERTTGRPVAPLVSWQDSRAVSIVDKIAADGGREDVHRISGLPLDPMFSAAKAAWLLDEHDPDRARARRGELCLGTVDSWLTSTAGEHVIEAGNASRTQLLDVRTGQWSTELLDVFGVPLAVLPDVRASAGRFPRSLDVDGSAVPVVAVLGDSHAALFGHGVRSPGTVKATYGTGSSLMTLLEAPPVSTAGLCLTIAWQLAGGAAPQPALEGNIRASGATLAWSGRLFGITPQEVADLADGASSEGVHLVPGFGGLGAPWWDAAATGLIDGLTLGSSREQVCRAALEAVAFQVMDLVDAARACGAAPTTLLADGGASVNDTLMQLQADLAGITVSRSPASEMSAIGAAHLAGLQAGLWDEDVLRARREAQRTFEPTLPAAERSTRRDAWHAAVARARRTRPSTP
jgi:glycerol kinase